MVEPRKYRLYIAEFSYAGNGGYQSCHPDVSRWLRETDRKLMKDPRILSVTYGEHADTPVNMARNNAVVEARKANADLLMLIDSDMQPDCELGRDPTAKPFWDSSFDFIDSMWDKYPVVVGAVYAGPPMYEENIYVFKWQSQLTGNPDETDMQLAAFSRYEAALQTGIREVGALPTGLILYDMRTFDLIDPRHRYNQLRDLGLTSAEAARACPHWFDYEWNDCTASSKGSTEDVYNTRDISLAGIQKYGHNPVFCNWDAWAGHWKPKLVRKPQILTADSVSRSLSDVVLRGNQSGTRIEKVDFGGVTVQDTMSESPAVIVTSEHDDGLPSASHSEDMTRQPQVF